ncbi:TPA: hypothetical protein ACH3X3_011820 [Trebouxia sp. C0006]
MEAGIKRIEDLVGIGQTSEDVPEMQATINGLNELGLKFEQEFWPKLCSPEKAQSMLDAMQTQQQQIAQDFEVGSAELSLLEPHVL